VILNAPAFKAATGGLFRSIKWKGPGKYRLHVHVSTGQQSGMRSE
jgi:hypothetical protein